MAARRGESTTVMRADRRRAQTARGRTVVLLLAAILLAALLAACGATAAPLTGHWVKKASMTEERSWIGMAAVGGKIYAVGGMVGQLGKRLDSGEVYDPKADAWQPIAHMPTARSSAGLAAVGPNLYVIGGYAQSGTTDAVEIFDTQTGAWRTAGQPLPTKRFDMAIVAIGPLIYTIGGFDNQAMNTVEVYDTQSGHWSSLPPVPTARYAFQAVAVDGKIWAMGGRNNDGATDVIEVYDPAKQVWTRSGYKLVEPLAGYGAVLAPGRLHIAKYDKHWAMDLKSGRWAVLPAMPTSRHGLQLAYVDGVVYAVGGCTPGEGNLFDVARNEAFITDSAPAP
jgi:hypothetical protein